MESNKTSQTSSIMQLNESLTNSQILNCPACNGDRYVREYEQFENYYYSRTPDERREEYPHSSRHNSYYCCEADYCDYDIWFDRGRHDSDPTYYIGKRTNFCYFRPFNNKIVYVCYDAHQTSH
ncbi:hypothetical protein I4U23_016977 [Adineta vaga]|nr:hypothetical protein I4U23_016977 [Adineta vaga]